MLGTSFHFSLWNTQSCRLSESIGPFLSKVVVVRTEDHGLHGGVGQLENQAGGHFFVELEILIRKCLQPPARYWKGLLSHDILGGVEPEHDVVLQHPPALLPSPSPPSSELEVAAHLRLLRVGGHLESQWDVRANLPMVPRPLKSRLKARVLLVLWSYR